ncbi:MAG: amino acid--tRNA ligase-related protein [Candidatus Vidania fulgoroideorum]
MNEKKKLNLFQINYLGIGFVVYTIARLVSKRNFGSILFFNIVDYSGEIQIIINKTCLEFEFFIVSKKVCVGDILFVKGITVLNNNNKKCVLAKVISIVSKNYLYFPDKYHKVKHNISKNYVFDFYLNSNKYSKILFRSSFIREIRNYMHFKNFVELETPILNNITGGALVSEFETFHNFYKRKMYLRVSPEIYLKKALICGFDNIFEIGKNFRNENISKNHYPEFTSMEFYISYKNYKYSMHFLENMIKRLFFNLLKSNILFYDNYELNLNSNFKKMTFLECILKYDNSENISNINNICFLKSFLFSKFNDLDKSILKSDNLSIFQYLYFDKFISKKIFFPTFVTNQPRYFSPLAKSKLSNCNFVERFELFMFGKEVADGFSELNDFVEQKAIFEAQSLKTGKKIDESFLNLMKFGMPFSTGCGVGIDRLLMILTNSLNIKDVLFFKHN